MTSADPRHWHQVPNAAPSGTLLCQRDALPDGQVTLHAVAGSADSPPSPPFQVLLMRSGSVVKAYVNRCAHFGVPLSARQDLLIYKAHESVSCNVHYARYRWEDGLCTSGDCAGESLLPIPLEVDAEGAIRIAGQAIQAPT